MSPMSVPVLRAPFHRVAGERAAPLPEGRWWPAPAPAVELPEPAARGCGSWFESSRELLQGMRVIEHAGFEALAPEVPLAWQLAGY